MAATLPLVLASTSPVRARLLTLAGLDHTVVAPRVDEVALRNALKSDGADARTIADALAEAKARKVAGRHPAARVIGCDQILHVNDRCLDKPEDRAAAAAQLAQLQGRSHDLFSAVVVYDAGAPVWRSVQRATLTMRRMDDAAIDRYLDRAWPGIAGCVGAYRLEDHGVGLFVAVAGEYTAILGLPMPPLLAWLQDRGELG
jgi:septum formation protein